MATNHSREMECDVEIACLRDGTILGLRGHVYGDMGAYMRTNGGVVPAKAAQFLPGPYRIRDVAITVEMLATNKTPVGTMRAPGRFEANFFRERLLDMVARDLGLDPMEFRRKNLIREAELPFYSGKLVPYEGETEFDTGDYHVTFERALTEIGWEEKKSLQGRLIDGRYHGLAAVPFIESGGSGKENCRARDRSRRHGHRLCRLGGERAGARNHAGAGRRRNAAAAVRPHPHPARLDHLSARGLRHVCVKVDGGRRLGGGGRLQQSHRRGRGRGAPSASACPTSRSSSPTAW